MTPINNKVLKIIRNFIGLVLSVVVIVLIIGTGGEEAFFNAIFLGPVLITAIIFGIIFFTKTLNSMVNVFRNEEQIEKTSRGILSKIGKYMFRGTLVILAIFTIYYYYSIFK